jgi:hypothetical protein
MAKAAKDEGRDVPVVWVGLTDMPVIASNTLISQFHKDLFILNFGFVNAPPLMGTPEEVKKQVEAIGSITVTPIARLALTENEIARVIKILEENLDRCQP